MLSREYISQISNALVPDDTKAIVSKIEAMKNKGIQRFIDSQLQEFFNSERYQGMTESNQYFSGSKMLIDDKQRTVIGRTQENRPTLKVSKTLTNNKLKHGFLRKLVKQKVSYLLSNPFQVISDKDGDVAVDRFRQELKNYMGKSFYRTFKRAAIDSILFGIGWLYVYYNENGELKIKRFDSREVIPFWADADHTVLDAFIRYYKIDDYTEDEKKEIVYVDYYDAEGIRHFEYNGVGQLSIRKDIDHFEPYLTVEEGIPASWEKIPLIPVKYQVDEVPLLDNIKSLIDDYNEKRSALANDIDDFPNSTTVVKGYDGESREMFIQMKNEYHTMFVDGDGDANVLNTPIDYSAVKSHTDTLRQDIYEFGDGVDTRNREIKNISGVALRMMYDNLNSDCLDWGVELEVAIMSVFWFIQRDILNKGGEDFTDVKYSIKFNISMIVNESEEIINAYNSYGVISDRTIASHHPYVKDGDLEYNKLMEERENNLELLTKYGENPEIEEPANGQVIKVT